jgi:hypothetical protein
MSCSGSHLGITINIKNTKPFIDWKSRSVMKGMAMLEFSLCLLSFTVLLESPTHSPVAKKRLEISKRLSESHLKNILGLVSN